MRKPVVLIGIGEMGAVFGRAFLRAGHPVYPVTRQTDSQAMARELPDPQLVIVAVGESDLDRVLESLPAPWRPNALLLQNELLPRHWLRHGLEKPTVISVWFEKKKGQEAKVIIPSPVYGPHAQQVGEALGTIHIASRVLASEQELLQELVLKNLYILTTNIAGLEVDGTVGQLWENHERLAREIASEVLNIQEYLTETRFDRERLIRGMLAAFEGDPDHKCMGRTALQRLERALAVADQADLRVLRLRAIYASR